MTERPAVEWERLDAAAVTPRPAISAARASSSGAARSGLRRSKAPVLAALDGGGAMLQRHMREVLAGSVVVLAPAVAVNLWATAVAFDRFDPADTFLPTSRTTGTGVEDIASWLALVVASLITAIVGLYVAQILIGDRFGTPIGFARAMRSTIRRFPSIVVAWLVGHCWVPLAALAIVTAQDEDVGGFVTMFAVVGWFASSFTLYAMPAMVGEQLGPFAALRRSFRLCRLRFGASMLFVLLSTIVVGAFLTGLVYLAPLLEVTGFITFGGAVWIVQGILVQLGVLFMVPLVALGTAQMYLEVRLDAEGLDLVIDADAAFGAAR